MKVVITGANSYIGNHIQSYIQSVDDRFSLYQLDVADPSWTDFDFFGYDTVVHVAAIVHRKDIDDWNLYENVNVNLTVRIAEKAKAQGVKHFIFLSSMAVYSAGKTLRKKKNEISSGTPLSPTSMYGKSKYLAEKKLLALESEGFSIAIVRPPNVYGPGCKGGYISTYAAIVRKLPAIPKAFTSVKQSVLYVDNLSRFIYLLILACKSGIYTPQDSDCVSAVEIMQYISESLGLQKKTSMFLGLFVYPLFFTSLVKKGFGGIAYREEDSHGQEFNYQVVSCKEGIERTVLYGTQRDHSDL